MYYKAGSIVALGFFCFTLSGCSPSSSHSRADSSFDNDSANAAGTIGPASRIQNLPSFIQALDLAPLYGESGSAHRIRVAVLDNSFAGYDQVLGDKLPSDTQYHAGPVDPGEDKDPHGLIMSELLYGLMTDGGQHPELAPELHLYNTNGYSNFKAAVNDCVQRKVDLILYAQVWEYGGNLDGRGFINSVVNAATASGIIWVNASGDFGDTTFTSAIADGSDEWVKLPDANSSVQLRCAAPAGQTCPLRLVLSWNSFADDVNTGTDKDLDLFLVDDTQNTVASSQLTQVTSAHDGQGYSLYPREIIETQLAPGTYYARVKDRSRSFGASDRLRLTASGDRITMPSHVSDDTLLTPADNRGVIAVGASDSAKTGVSRATRKPEILAPSLLMLTGNAQFKGTSSAASAVAATIALLKTVEPDQFPNGDRAAIIDLVRARLQAAPASGGDDRSPTPAPTPTPTSTPGQDSVPPPPTTGTAAFGPTGPNGCYAPLPIQSLPSYVQSLGPQGGVAVQTTAGPMVLFGFDPQRLIPSQFPAPGDLVVTGPVGVALYHPTGQPLPAGVYPLARFPDGSTVCF